MTPPKLSLLTRTRFNTDLDAVVYELILSTLLMSFAASSKQDAVNCEDDPDAVKLFNHYSATDRLAAKRIREAALNNLSTLYGIEYSDMPPIDEQTAIAAQEFLKLARMIAQATISKAMREGLSEQQAMDRVVYTKLRSK